MRVRARKDDNHKEIADVYRKMGCSVLDTSMVGSGAPDIIVGLKQGNHLVEIKDGKKKPSARRLTPDEERFHIEWRGPIRVISTVDEAIAHVNEVRGVAWEDLEK